MLLWVHESLTYGSTKKKEKLRDSRVVNFALYGNPKVGNLGHLSFFYSKFCQ